MHQNTFSIVIGLLILIILIIILAVVIANSNNDGGNNIDCETSVIDECHKEETLDTDKSTLSADFSDKKKKNRKYKK